MFVVGHTRDMPASHPRPARTERTEHHPRRTQAERTAETTTKLLDATAECLAELGYARTLDHRDLPAGRRVTRGHAPPLPVQGGAGGGGLRAHLRPSGRRSSGWPSTRYRPAAIASRAAIDIAVGDVQERHLRRPGTSSSWPDAPTPTCAHTWRWWRGRLRETIAQTWSELFDPPRRRRSRCGRRSTSRPDLPVRRARRPGRHPHDAACPAPPPTPNGCSPSSRRWPRSSAPSVSPLRPTRIRRTPNDRHRPDLSPTDPSTTRSTPHPSPIRRRVRRASSPAPQPPVGRQALRRLRRHPVGRPGLRHRPRRSALRAGPTTTRWARTAWYRAQPQAVRCAHRAATAT